MAEKEQIESITIYWDRIGFMLATAGVVLMIVGKPFLKRRRPLIVKVTSN